MDKTDFGVLTRNTAPSHTVRLLLARINVLAYLFLNFIVKSII